MSKEDTSTFKIVTNLDRYDKFDLDLLNGLIRARNLKLGALLYNTSIHYFNNTGYLDKRGKFSHTLSIRHIKK